MKVYLVAGEPSGDKLGAELMAGLKSCAPYELDFCGVGGFLMEEQGLTSLFPISEIAVMGIGEILAKYSFLKKRIKNTVDDILRLKPDVLITIDAPEFSLRVAKMVRKKLFINTVHYVAPTVWAWRPNRAKKISSYVDHILALFPFEPPYMQREGISCDFVGHPVVSENLASLENIIDLKKDFSLADEPKILCLPGSRKSEIDRLMPTFGKTLHKFLNYLPSAKFILPSTPNVFEYSKKYLEYFPKITFFLTPENIGFEKYIAHKKASFKIADLALAASGTVSLELAANNTPMVIGYDMNYFSRQMIQFMMKTDTVTLVNLITGNRNIPECIGADFNSEKLFLEMVRVFSNNKNQIKDFKTTMDLLGKNDKDPNVTAANSLIKFYNKFKAV